MPDPKPEISATPTPAPKQPPSFRQRVVLFAEAEIGVKEDPLGSNSGDRVNQYLASVNLGPGYAWCLAYAHWATMHAALHAGIPCPIPATGLCSALFKFAKEENRLTRNPRPGDIGLRKGGPRGHDHAVVVIERIPGNYVRSVAGNTSVDGRSREGVMVARRTYAMEDLDFVSVETT